MGFAVVLARLTSGGKAAAPPAITAADDQAGTALVRLPYQLTFSAEIAEMELTAGNQPPAKTPSGVLEAAPDAPLFLTVRWKTPPVSGEHRFAKLVVEPAGKPTVTHVFDAEGDIDDVFELP